MAFAAVSIAQHAALAFRRGRGRCERGLGLRLNDSQRIASRLALGSVVSVAIEARPILARTTILPRAAVVALEARTLLAWSFIARPILARPVVFRPLVSRPLVSGAIISWAIISWALIAPRTITAALAVGAAVIAIAVVVAGTLVARPVPGSIIARLLPVSWALLAVAVASLPAFRRVAGFSGGCVGGFGLGLGAFVFEIDVETGGEVVAAEDFTGRAGGLHGPKKAEIVFGVLQIVLAENPVAGGRRVPGQLLIFLENVLGVAAHFGPFGTIGIEGSVGVLRLRLAAASATPAAAAVAAALTLHTLEISHYLMTVLVP